MSENAIELEPVGNLLGKNFFIPNYQRGYRWKKQQVKDLLDDIEEFIELQKKSEKNDGFYCIQPLVVKGISNKDAAQNIRNAVKNGEPSDDKDFIQYVKNETQIAQWEVIDGQQRLTTIFILLSYLEEKNLYKLEYETRKTTGSDSADFLNNIANKNVENCTNIDFFHMYNAYKAIVNWFEPKGEKGVVIDEKKKSDEAIIDSKDKENENQKYDVDKNKKLEEFKQNFKEILLKQVKFIWYESTDEDPIKVFTRLNIGKISLTNAELIKALFLNRSNFSEGDANIRLKQQEIASEWDKIEYTLQNDEFWLFLNQRGYDKPTRIDMIFDLICEQKSLGIGTQNIGTDQYKTFRYFYNFFKLAKENYPAALKDSDKSKIEFCWSKVKDVFQIFEEWYNDLELYHYVGYLVDQGEKISDLLTLWTKEKPKQDFIGELKEKIKGKISNCNDLTLQYEMDKYPKKTQCRPLLLLHNIQTVINQNNGFIKSEKYNLPVFYKFPFHLYKKEASSKERYGWEIEHISPNSGDNDNAKNIKIYLKSVENSIELSESIKKEIDEYVKNLNDTENIKIEVFNDLKQKIKTELKEDDWTEETTNRLWNFTLLDSETNQEYQNYVFSFKRICILSKERGEKTICTINQKNEVVFSEKSGIAFVLPCTKNVFTKAYTRIPQRLSSWTYEDAKNYLLNINEVLKNADFIQDQTNVINKLFNKVKFNEGENNE